MRQGQLTPRRLTGHPSFAPIPSERTALRRTAAGSLCVGRCCGSKGVSNDGNHAPSAAQVSCRVFAGTDFGDPRRCSAVSFEGAAQGIKSAEPAHGSQPMKFGSCVRPPLHTWCLDLANRTAHFTTSGQGQEPSERKNAGFRGINGRLPSRSIRLRQGFGGQERATGSPPIIPRPAFFRSSPFRWRSLALCGVASRPRCGGLTDEGDHHDYRKI